MEGKRSIHFELLAHLLMEVVKGEKQSNRSRRQRQEGRPCLFCSI